MNCLLHRLIPALLSLSLPFSLQATEAETTDMPESAAMTQAQTSADEAGTTTETAAAQGTTPENAEADEPMAEAAVDLTTEATAADVSATAATAVAVETADESFAITSFEITGNLLLPVETIEKTLQRFIGESRSRDDLFSIRHAVIKLYRSHDLDGVAVAVPTPGEAGLLEVKIFEDDIDAYPQQSAKAERTAQPEVVADSPPATPAQEATTDTPRQPKTYAIKLDPVEKPAVVVIPAVKPIEPATEERIETVQAEAAALVDQAEVEAEAAPVLSAASKPEAEEIVAVETEVKTLTSEKVMEKSLPVEGAAVKSAQQTTAQAIQSTPVATAKTKATPTVTARTDKPAKVKAANNKQDTKAKKRPKAEATKSAEKAPAVETAEAVVIADAKQGSFNISSFEIYGNSLVTTAAIRKLLQPYIGAGKSYADLIDAKQKISQLYRNKGHKMVAIGMPARIFGETIPVRIYEAKRSRATDLSMN